ncbi:MAG: hypothetical protein NTZ49_02055 [Candidatus Parcubacteria bacterium]|nr:hypothetical protein [Candidatus Parcubacteria bacterium]
MAKQSQNLLIKTLERVAQLADKGLGLSVEEVRVLISDITKITKIVLIAGGFSERDVTRLTTKLRDAGRRSPPWTPYSGRVPGRPQDGADGNRRLRWLFTEDHKFYADEINATLVEVKYYLQVLSMTNAPLLPENTIQDKFTWLVKHRIIPGEYKDPIQLVPIDLRSILSDLRILHSGHLVPLDRGGRHEPKNTFLVLARSNQLQGNLTLAELLVLMNQIVEKHNRGEGDII